MILEQPWFRATDVYRISITTTQPSSLLDVQDTTASSKTPNFVMETSPLSLPQQRSLLRLCRRASHIPSTNCDVITLVSQIRASQWSTVWKSRAEDREELFIINLVPETHSDMIWREFYTYEVVLKGSPVVPRFHGMFQRPIGDWFAFCLEDVGDNLEKIYGLGWSEVKRSMPRVQWRKFLESVKQLHPLGIMRGDLEPRNVAQIAQGFKFFDFGRSELHHCQRD
ncbi:uncharacterized protein BT62DRAFT_1002265 [Guyanagaster necrorhizus]|uniref:Protein kinase domain-containing protein n=1 Tax=Guyanagaster necrorhizus TaxID=856835 RepID=A0A9P7VZB9_9AGAR|nr:uncharacterized protein BT62DRAFT_1002265 [Guyanagaster necrorhizus MCA 3950]KAG7449938.1 hypothetical protein BT62DRAFT_1002265 [Guyanagaster necrorhizus MCA 3950]